MSSCASLCDAAHGLRSQDPIEVLVGSVIRARIKKFKELLNALIKKVWVQEQSRKTIGDNVFRAPIIITIVSYK